MIGNLEQYQSLIPHMYHEIKRPTPVG